MRTENRPLPTESKLSRVIRSVVLSKMRRLRSSRFSEKPTPAVTADRGISRTSTSKFCRLMPKGSIAIGVAAAGALSNDTRWTIENSGVRLS